MSNSMPATRPNLDVRVLWMQVRDHFLELIASGEWLSDQPIESEIDLARTLNVSTGTVRKALNLLKADGLVVRRQGRGTIVSNQCSEELSAKYCNLRIGDGRHRVTGLVERHDFEEVLASDEEKRQLHLGGADRVFRCKRIRQYHGRRFMFETVVLPQRLLPNLTVDDFSKPRVAFIGAKRHNMLIGNAEERVDIAYADEETASALCIDVKKPLLRLDRILYCHTGRRLEWRVALCDLREKYYMADLG